MGGPAYSTAHGPCVEGDRMIVGLMRMKAGTGAEPHSHPNEQWIYVLEGTFRATIDGKPSRGQARLRALHPGRHDPRRQGDGRTATSCSSPCKDASHSLHGIKAARTPRA